MLYIYLIIIFILGLLIGSFLNVVIFRLETEENIAFDRSKCPSCKHILSWKDLFPVLSFIFLKGKCRYCLKKISIQYPLVELMTASFFVFIFSYFFSVTEKYFIANIIFYFFIISSFIVISVYDLRHYIIPDKVIYPAIIITALFNFIFASPIFLNHLFSAIVAFGFFFVIIVLTKGQGMGGGDAKLGFLMGLILGWPLVFLAIFLASISGSIIGLALIIGKKKKIKSMIPFGPFLIFGTVVSIFYGEEIVQWYFDLFL
ncbi:MAG: prepilin peptidase [Candidatus Pacebacteria bacterium]|nr:prepilin peptidase [Candidatus Paceibacterota bacterium]